MKLAMSPTAFHPRASSSKSSNLTSLPYESKYKSPKLHQKWKQYQGINNWKGLLDPLDDNLRSEILRYGHFIDAAYRSFDYEPSSLTYGMCLYTKRSLLNRCGLAHSGYKLTKNLYVTCGINVPTWINKIPTWMRIQSSWIGYVAICKRPKERLLLGRRDVVIVFRGTTTCLEWLENLSTTLTHLPGLKDCVGVHPMVQKGFLSLYMSKTTTCLSLQEMIREEIERIIQSYTNESISLTLAGHSLGAALAILSAYDINATFKNLPMVTVFSFGGPRVGNNSFKNQMEQSGIRILRIVNPDDVVTKIPGFVVNNDDDVLVEGKDVLMRSLLAWMHRRLEDMQLVYADIGQELRLNSKGLPYLNKGDVATCHDLKTYLYLVKNFVSSSCSPRRIDPIT